MTRKLELTDEEYEEFKNTIKQDMRNSVIELSHTDAHAYKQIIKDRIRILEQIAYKLGESR